MKFTQVAIIAAIAVAFLLVAGCTDEAKPKVNITSIKCVNTYNDTLLGFGVVNVTDFGNEDQLFINLTTYNKKTHEITYTYTVDARKPVAAGLAGAGIIVLEGDETHYQIEDENGKVVIHDLYKEVKTELFANGEFIHVPEFIRPTTEALIKEANYKLEKGANGERQAIKDLVILGQKLRGL
jgi:hypothetical protein